MIYQYMQLTSVWVSRYPYKKGKAFEKTASNVMDLEEYDSEEARKHAMSKRKTFREYELPHTRGQKGQQVGEEK